MQPGLLGALTPQEQYGGLLEPAKRPMRGKEAIGLARGLLEQSPGYNYGQMLPMAQHRETGDYSLALPEFARESAIGLLDLLEGPRTGEMTPEATMALFDIPLARAASAAVRGARPDPNQLGIFAGVGAKTANRGALEIAERMAKEGADPRAIWRETGWFQGPDAKWRWEIDDSGARIADNAVRPVERYGVFGDVQKEFDHPALHQAYDLPYDLDARRGSSGSFARQPTYWGTDVPSRQVRAGDIDERGRLSVRGSDADDIRGTTLHELQHAVQAQEGFAPGGNLSDEAAQIAAARDAEMTQRILGQADPSDVAAISRYDILREQWEGKPDIPQDVRDEVSAILARPGVKAIDEQLQDVRRMRLQAQGGRGALESGLIDRGEAYEQYRRLAGEAEARAVQARRDMTPEQRRATYPMDSFDVPADELIIRGPLAGGGSQMSVEPDLPEQIAGLLAQGRASEVTDDMLGLLDANQNARLVELYEQGATGMPMPMDEASRIGRAREMGLLNPAFHGTRRDFPAFESGDVGFHVGTDEQASRRLVTTRRERGLEGENIQPLTVKSDRGLMTSDAGEWNDARQAGRAMESGGLRVRDIIEEAEDLAPQYADVDEWKWSGENAGLLDDLRLQAEAKGYDHVRYANEVENAYGDLPELTRAGKQMKDALNRERQTLQQDIYARRPGPPDNPTPESIDEWLALPEPQPTPQEATRLAEISTELSRIERELMNDNTSSIIFDPANIRSRFARFDPRLAKNANLLASVGGAGLLGLLALPDDYAP